jgi:hypothetical protein
MTEKEYINSEAFHKAGSCLSILNTIVCENLEEGKEIQEIRTNLYNLKDKLGKKLEIISNKTLEG